MDSVDPSSSVISEYLAALHHECTTHAKRISEQSGVEIPDEIASFVTETTFRFCQLLATDIESFGRHAKRSTINTEDVLLFTRRNPHLVKFLEDKSVEYDVAADAGAANPDIHSVKKKKQSNLQAKGKSKNGASSKSKDSPLKSPPLKAFLVQSNQPASKTIATVIHASPSKTASSVGQMNTTTPSQLMESKYVENPEHLETSPENLQNLKASTPRKSDLGSSVVNAFETPLCVDTEDFSSIFDDFDIS